MTTADDFSLLRHQISIFTPQLDLKIGKLLAHLQGKWGEAFDKEPVIYPTVDTAAKEFPRFRLSNGAETLTLQVATGRLDVIFESIDPDKTMQEQFLRQACEIVDDYIRFNHAIVARMAVTKSRISRNELPAITLSSHFCKEEWTKGPLKRPESFEMHAHKIYQMNEKYDVNSWMRVKSAELLPVILVDKSTDQKSASLILVEQDINTVFKTDPALSFSREAVADFIQQCNLELDSILLLYFPVGD